MDKSCASVTDTFSVMLAEQSRQAQEEREKLFPLLSTRKDGEKKAQPQQTGGQAETGAPMPPDDEDENKNIQKINDDHLKRKGLDAHKIKEEFMGKGSNSRYDLYVNKDTGEVIIFHKGGKGQGTNTGYFIK